MNFDERINQLPQGQRDRLLEIKSILNMPLAGKVLAGYFIHTPIKVLDDYLSKDGRNSFLSWIFDRDIKTSKVDEKNGLTAYEVFRIVNDWAKPVSRIADCRNNEMSLKLYCGQQFISDVQLLVLVFSGGVGQLDLFENSKQENNNEITKSE